MSTTFIQPGEVVECVAPSGGVVSGTAYKIGTLLVVAMTTALEDTIFRGRASGIFTLPRTVGASSGWAAGAILYWDATAGALIKAKSASASRVGWAPVAAGDDDTTAIVRLTGAPSIVNVD